MLRKYFYNRNRLFRWAELVELRHYNYITFGPLPFYSSKVGCGRFFAMQKTGFLYYICTKSFNKTVLKLKKEFYILWAFFYTQWYKLYVKFGPIPIKSKLRKIYL